jgi:hypothetical protein
VWSLGVADALDQQGGWREECALPYGLRSAAAAAAPDALYVLGGSSDEQRWARVPGASDSSAEVEAGDSSSPGPEEERSSAAVLRAPWERFLFVGEFAAAFAREVRPGPRPQPAMGTDVRPVCTGRGSTARGRAGPDSACGMPQGVAPPRESDLLAGLAALINETASAAAAEGGGADAAAAQQRARTIAALARRAVAGAGGAQSSDMPPDAAAAAALAEFASKVCCIARNLRCAGSTGSVARGRAHLRR